MRDKPVGGACVVSVAFAADGLHVGLDPHDADSEASMIGAAPGDAGAEAIKTSLGEPLRLPRTEGADD